MSSTLPLATAFTGATVTEGQFKQAMTDQRTFLNDPDTYQWYAPGLAPTYVSTVSFTLVGDQTAAFHVGRRFKAVVTAGTVYGTITASAYTTLTTITVVLDSGALDSGLTVVYLSVLTSSPSAVPGTQSLAANGYKTLPGGLILQWGLVTTAATGLGTWTYPIAFPNSAYIVLPSVVILGAHYAVSVDGTPTTTAAQLRLSAVVSTNVFVFAIGK